MNEKIHICQESPDQPDVLQLIKSLDDYQIPLYPLESYHGLSLESLLRPNILFAVARLDNREAVGCGALMLDGSHAEIKRMFTAEKVRRMGVGKTIMDFLETSAKKHGKRIIFLETGIFQFDAIRFYLSRGYQNRKEFGDYLPDENSIFMEKKLNF